MKIIKGPLASNDSGTGNLPITRIVIHSAVAPCVPGMALRIAAYFASGSAAGSAHLVVDPEMVVECLPDDVVAWHAPPNLHSLGIEMCDQPARTLDRWYPGKDPAGADRRLLRFIAPAQRAMLRRTADVTALKALEHGVPLDFLSVADLVAGRRGITSHANVSEAFHQSTHWDPGSWPKGAFMRRVRRTYKRLEEAS